VEQCLDKLLIGMFPPFGVSFFPKIQGGGQSSFNYFYKPQLKIMCLMLNEIRERCNATFNFFCALDI
jgi:hypothetical protein